MNVLRWLFDAQIQFGDQILLVREVLGNLFGLASALGGMRRKVWAWPIGIAGNLLLFTVFMGAFFGSPNPINMLGQAGRQIMFITVSVWGWYRWRQSCRAQGTRAEGAAVIPRWASRLERFSIISVLILGTIALTPISFSRVIRARMVRCLDIYRFAYSDLWYGTRMGRVLANLGCC